MYQIQIAISPEQIQSIIHLRFEILRKPWNQSIESATDDLETTSINAYIEKDGITVACGRLQDNGNQVGQIRYMAVANNYQGKGLGKLILNRLEEEAKKIGITQIELQARENAVEFYKANNYLVAEKSFKLWDIIQHYKMTKTIK